MFYILVVRYNILMEKENSFGIQQVISVKHDEIYFSDKNRAENKMFYFDLVWFIITFASSIYKFSKVYYDKNDVMESLYFLGIFALPILCKHIIRYDFFKTLRDSLGRLYKYISIFSNVAFVIVFLFFGFVLVNLYNLTDTQSMLPAVVPLHIIVLFIGMYDRIVMKMIPKVEEEKKND